MGKGKGNNTTCCPLGWDKQFLNLCGIFLKRDILLAPMVAHKKALADTLQWLSRQPFLLFEKISPSIICVQFLVRLLWKALTICDSHYSCFTKWRVLLGIRFVEADFCLYFHPAVSWVYRKKAMYTVKVIELSCKNVKKKINIAAALYLPALPNDS